MITAIKRGIRSLVSRAGFDIVRRPRDARYSSVSHDDSRALPAGAAEYLLGSNPKLLALRERYAACALPMRVSPMWDQDKLGRELDLGHFRGDNVYVWQFRNMRDAARQKYYMFMRDLASRDPLGLLRKLSEDGAFGCWTFDFPGWPLVSRDLLDSINELYFLDRHVGLLQTPGMTVLDIGAGYGRMAHRALTAAPGIGAWLCADAVPESTFLSEYYLGHRQCLGKAEILPLDELDARLAGRRIDLAINIHSFSEMGTAAIEGWIARVAALGIPWIFIVPNDADQLLSMEQERKRKPFGPILEAHGYELKVCQPIIEDPTLRELMGATDHFFLFRRKPAVRA